MLKTGNTKTRNIALDFLRIHVIPFMALHVCNTCHYLHFLEPATLAVNENGLYVGSNRTASIMYIPFEDPANPRSFFDDELLSEKIVSLTGVSPGMQPLPPG